MGIDFALSEIFLLDVGTSDNDFIFTFDDICVVQICCFVWCVLLYYCFFSIFQLSLYNVLLFILAYQSDTLGPFRQYQTRYPRDKVTFAKTEWITNGQFRATCNIGNTTQNGLIWTNCGPNVILSRYFIHHQCYVHGNYQRIIAHLCVKIYLCNVNVYNYLFLLMIWILLEEVVLSCRHIYAYSNE